MSRRGLILDPFAGISGDMMLGALVDLGLREDWLRDFVASLGLAGVDVHVARATRRGLDAGRVTFDLPQEHAHRHLQDVLAIVDGTTAPDRAKQRAHDAFRRIASAEAAVHGTTVDEVHFHEVGALDAILDVLCVMAAVDELKFDEFYTRPVAVGHGWIDIAHGRFPVPAPATLRLLEGIAVTGHELEGECTTPTGAALVATLSAGRQPPSAVTVAGVGFGAGARDPADRPNCLRLVACIVNEELEHARLHLVQADIDDMPAEYLPSAQEALIAAGAIDATVTSITMKKGRPGLRIEALVPVEALDAAIQTVFRSTSTIGLRHWPVSRPQLERDEHTIEWRGQTIRVKRVRLPDGSERVKPEYADVARAAQALGLTPFEVRAAITSQGILAHDPAD